MRRAVLACTATAAMSLTVPQSAAAAPATTLSAFGLGAYGQLGSGGVASSPVPLNVSGLARRVVAVAAGCEHSLAVTADGAVWAWGLNSDGELGDGRTASHTTPELVSGLPGDAVAVAAGCHHSLALTSDGEVWEWGESTISAQVRPVHATALDGLHVVSIAAGGEHSAAVTRSGDVYAWGDNRSGQLGLGDTAPHAQPTRVSGLASVSQVALGMTHSLFLTNGGVLLASGGNEHGQLGDGTTTDRPTPVTVAHDVSAASAGDEFSIAVTSARTVLAWGRADSGQLGTATASDRPTPAAVAGVGDVVAAAAGGRHVLAVTRDGTVLAWGDGGDGQLGQGTEAMHPVTSPSAVPGIGGAIAVAAGDAHSLVLTSPASDRALTPASDTAGAQVVTMPNTSASGTPSWVAALAAVALIAGIAATRRRRRSSR